jgi:Txe/YoeB family toxin of Txe-Axe toxin-antitoxin module
MTKLRKYAFDVLRINEQNRRLAKKATEIVKRIDKQHLRNISSFQASPKDYNDFVRFVQKRFDIERDGEDEFDIAREEILEDASRTLNALVEDYEESDTE